MKTRSTIAIVGLLVAGAVAPLRGRLTNRFSSRTEHHHRERREHPGRRHPHPGRENRRDRQGPGRARGRDDRPPGRAGSCPASSIPIRTSRSKGTSTRSGDLITSEVDVKDVINPQDLNIYYALTGGVTSIDTMHGSANPIAGRGIVLKMRWGGSAEDMIFKGAPAISKWALGENPKQSNSLGSGKARYPKTRMGVEASIRLEFELAKEYARKWRDYDKALEDESGEQGKDSSPRPAEKGPPARRHRRYSRRQALGPLSRLPVRGDAVDHAALQGIRRQARLFRTRARGLPDRRRARPLRRGHLRRSPTSGPINGRPINTMPYDAALAAKKGVLVALNSDDAERMRHLFNDAAKTVRFGGLPSSRPSRP